MKQARDHASDLRLLSGVPDGIRTHGLLLRRQTLYPAELRGRVLMSGLMAGRAPGDHDQTSDEKDDHRDKHVRPVMVRILLRVVTLHVSSFHSCDLARL